MARKKRPKAAETLNLSWAPPYHTAGGKRAPAPKGYLIERSLWSTGGDCEECADETALRVSERHLQRAGVVIAGKNFNLRAFQYAGASPLEACLPDLRLVHAPAQKAEIVALQSRRDARADHGRLDYKGPGATHRIEQAFRIGRAPTGLKQ